MLKHHIPTLPPGPNAGHIVNSMKDLSYQSTYSYPQSPYSAVAYDIFWVAAMAENVTRYNESNDSSNQSVKGLKEAIMSSANSYLGVTGITTLNKIGNRAEGQYEYWKVTAKVGEGNSQAFNWNNTTN
jgi:hypothetical protein